MKSGTDDLIRQLIVTRTSNSVDECLSSLISLRPDRLDTNEILELIYWVEAQAKKIKFPISHINVFGTGGDHTLNISSMSTIIASHFTTIKKIGTGAVTSKHGSSDFFKCIQTWNLKPHQKPFRNKISLNNASEFISLDALGFPYSKTLRSCRIELANAKIPDIYKATFPYANYTDPKFQITGAATETYLKIFDKVSGILGRNVCIVRSEEGYDEIMPGKNLIIIHQEGKRFEFNWHSPGTRNVFSEPSTIEEVVSLFIECVIEGKNSELRETLLHNAALLLTMSRLESPIKFSDIMYDSITEIRSIYFS